MHSQIVDLVVFPKPFFSVLSPLGIFTTTEPPSVFFFFLGLGNRVRLRL
jgi:hypothetical protein